MKSKIIQNYEYYIFIIVYIIILIIQFFTISFLSNSKKIDKNDFITDENKIDHFIIDKLNERINILKKNDLDFFLKYNNQHSTIHYNGTLLYFFVFQRIVKKDESNQDVEYISRVYPDPKFNNLLEKDIISQTTYEHPFTSLKPKDSVMDVLYALSDNYEDGYKYFWVDAITKQLVQKKAFSKRIHINHFDGFIAANYNLNSVTKKYSNSYFDILKNNKFFLIIISLFIFFSSILIYHFDPDKKIFKPLLLFLIIPNLYLLYYLNITEDFSSYDEENNRLTLINNGILSVSFLIAVNIFILNTLNKSKVSDPIYIESVVIFAVSLLYLLFSLYKKTDYNILEQMKQIRVSKQLLFNLVIYYNVFMIINFLLFMYYDKIK
jgi:hypothetical protein